ncbi:nuclear transport factor 2 family protein [Raineyella sp. LH-20]|uniref:nuclear transport factor 2 family protein n=1 Tax=Raineyella sp. LH-20 TaxID=3081204 RepID=UPI0029559CBF|nr:nuclear transport factor 2 family protein [Raineyella sp. LH-20]WOP19282.1 nuclear transport factor 2 family protein [Raineyella sp. LH-20]
MATLETRLARLEAIEAVTGCLTCYLDLCDVPGPLADLDEIGALFTEQAVWEGIGPEYADTYGRAEGRAAVQALVGGYLPPVDHFVRNAHLLGAGQVAVTGRERADGRWLMQQLSLHTDGTAALRCARLRVSFALTAEQHRPPTALIHHFTTERLFATPIAAEAMAHLLS